MRSTFSSKVSCLSRESTRFSVAGSGAAEDWEKILPVSRQVAEHKRITRRKKSREKECFMSSLRHKLRKRKDIAATKEMEGFKKTATFRWPQQIAARVTPGIRSNRLCVFRGCSYVPARRPSEFVAPVLGLQRGEISSR